VSTGANFLRSPHLRQDTDNHRGHFTYRQGAKPTMSAFQSQRLYTAVRQFVIKESNILYVS